MCYTPVMKTCTQCKEQKDSSSFYLVKRKQNNTSYLRSICKTCHNQQTRAYSKLHYSKNKKQYEDRKTRNGVSYKQKQQFVRNLKDNKICLDCKRTYRYWMLDFDHRPGTIKICEMSHCYHKLHTQEAILNEASKCDIICTNCHRDRTFMRMYPNEIIKRWYE